MGRGAHDNEAVARGDEGRFAPDEAIAQARSGAVPGATIAPPSGRWGRAAPYAAVAAGGALGANLRSLVGLWAAAHWPGAFPWGTLLINLTGSLLLGALLTALAARRPDARLLRLFLATGLLGAYTTFSTFSAETVALIAAGHPSAAVAYALLSIGGGCGAARVGVAFGHRVR